MSAPSTPQADLRSRLLVTLRAIRPSRRLDREAAEQIAERQATLLRRELGLSQVPALPVGLIASLPFIRVAHEKQLPTPGVLFGTRHGWVIALKAEDAAVRQRFSLLHEFKHLLDDPFLGDEIGQFGRHDQNVERVCNHFAACALMPRILLKRDWGSGIQRTEALAARYGVSLVAMEIRLRQIGLIAPLKHGQPVDLTTDERSALKARLSAAWTSAPPSRDSVARLNAAPI